MQLHSMKFIERLLLVMMLFFAGLGILTIFAYSKNKPLYGKDAETPIPPKDQTYTVRALAIPETVSFAGERMPVERFDVREALDKELHKVCYWHSETFLYLKRAKRFFPVIEPILKAHHIPDDFKYLALAESGLENVTSPAGARGYWQFMESTAEHYGLEVNKEVDERYHIEKSTQAACMHLKSLYRRYGNWTMAAAAYNTGEGNLDRESNRQQQKSYYDLLLNSETARYVYRITAIKLIVEQPHKYGFEFFEDDLYRPLKYKTTEIDSSVSDFVAFAETQGISYKMLKIYNPWLRGQSLTNSKKEKYVLKLPE